MSNQATKEQLLISIGTVHTCTRMMKEDGMGRLAVGGALLNALNNVIDSGTSPEDCANLREIYVQALRTGNC